MNSFATFPTSTTQAATSIHDQASRMYHGFAAVAFGNTTFHCPHAGPSGGGALGAATLYNSWFNLTGSSTCGVAAYSWVQAQDAAALLYWSQGDLAAVIPPGNPATYTTTAYTSGNTVLCRIYHLTVAAESAAQAAIHCQHGSVGGMGACGNVSTNACGLILQACPTMYTDMNTCGNAIQTLINSNKTGNIMSMAGSTADDVACRVYNAGSALISRANATAMAGLCMMAGNCGMMGAPTMMPAGAPTNAAPLVAASVVIAMLPLFV